MKMMAMIRVMSVVAVWLLGIGSMCAQVQVGMVPGEIWPDDKGEHINAHGGCVLYHEGTYYWYGENRTERGAATDAGVGVYSSQDLVHWKNEGVALAVSDRVGDDIER